MLDLRKYVKYLHIASTGWFFICSSYVLIIWMRQAGMDWWLIFSLSGSSVVTGILLLSGYLLALYRGSVCNEDTRIEYPLSSTWSYMVFYDLSPFFGGGGAVLGMAVAGNLNNCLICSLSILPLKYLINCVISLLLRWCFQE